MRSQCKLLERAPAAQPRERALGDERAILLTHRSMAAKEVMEQRIGGRLQRRDVGNRGSQHGELIRAQHHGTGASGGSEGGGVVAGGGVAVVGGVIADGGVAVVGGMGAGDGVAVGGGIVSGGGVAVIGGVAGFGSSMRIESSVAST